MADIRDSLSALDGFIKLAENAQGIGSSDVRAAMEAGIPEAQKVTRRHLAQNYTKSGLKKRTGQLLGMIKRSVLSIGRGGSSSPNLVIAMPGGLKTEDYQKANALNYGAVRASSGSLLSQKGAKGRFLIGEKQRRKLKDSAGAIGKAGSGFLQVSRDLGARSGGTTKSGSAVVETTAGNATVTKAWKYYNLTNRQLLEVKDIIFGRAMEALTSMIRGEKRARKAA